MDAVNVDQGGLAAPFVTAGASSANSFFPMPGARTERPLHLLPLNPSASVLASKIHCHFSTCRTIHLPPGEVLQAIRTYNMHLDALLNASLGASSSDDGPVTHTVEVFEKAGKKYQREFYEDSSSRKVRWYVAILDLRTGSVEWQDDCIAGRFKGGVQYIRKNDRLAGIRSWTRA